MFEGRPAGMRLLRAARAPVAVAAARLRAEPLRPALVVAGVAIAFAGLVSVLGGSLVARQQALQRTVAALPAAERGFRVDRFGVTPDAATFRREDAAARRALAPLSPQPVLRLIFFRELSVQGELVEIAAVDGLRRAVRLSSGRLPRACSPSGCEVLQVGGPATGRSQLAEGGIRLRRVGAGALHEPELFASLSTPAGSRPALLLAPSVAALQRLPALAPFSRVYSWLSPLRAGTLRTWDVARILAAESRAQATLAAADPAFRLSGPDEPLLAATHRGSVASRRLVLVGGETSALLLGFAVVAAMGLRRGLASERRRLLARGARRWQLGLALAAELGTTTALGALLGVAAGAIAVAAIARTAGLPAAAILARALGGGWTPAALAAAWLATTVALALTALARGEESRRRVRALDVAALGALATIAVAVSRGALDPGAATAGTDVLLLVLPALACFVVAVLLARVLAPSMRAAERLVRDRSVSLRLAVLALARAPARTVVSCAFVAVAVGLALLAASYRATLARGARDQAAFRVPLDFVVSEGSRLVLPLDAAPVQRYDELAPDAGAYPVVRLTVNAPGTGASLLSPTLLGVPRDAIERLRWRSDFSPLSPRAIAARLGSGPEPRLAGPPVPRGTRTLTLRARLRGAAVSLGLVAEDGRGRVRVLPLGVARPGSSRLAGHVPAGSRLRVVGLQLALPESVASEFAHRSAEGGAAGTPAGTLALGPLVARRASNTRSRAPRVVTRWRGWRLRGTERSGRAAVGFAFPDTAARLVLRPREPTDGRPMPVVVSPDVARAAGGVGARTELDLGDATLEARIAGVARRMPTIPAGSGPFVVADAGRLSTAVDADAPGEGTPNEVWIAAPRDGARVAAALRRPPFSSLATVSRASIERRLSGDALAHATAVALGAAATAALALAVLGFWVGVVGELRDERSDLFDLEAQGLPPARLRAQLRTRASILVVLGLAAGGALGAILARLVVSLVRVSGTSGVPDPPLRVDRAWLTSGLALLAVAVATMLVAESTALAAFRGRRPRRASWSLE